MTNRERTIKGLEWIVNLFGNYERHAMDDEEIQSLNNAIMLLKDQEPKHGKWVRLTGMAPPEYHGHKVCSVCECLAPYDPIHPWREELSRYCPGCGAEMEGEVE